MALRSALVILVAVAATVVHAVGARAACPTPFELEVTLLVNAERAARGLAPLAIDDRLTAAAQGHSRDMAQNGFFSHTGSNGSRFDERIADEGYSGGPLAENIAAGYSSPEAAVTGWMNSDGHRANILNPSLRHIGVGHVHQPGSPYGHYWSQSFGGSDTLVATCGSGGGGGGGSTSSDAILRCQYDQLRAFAKLCRADLGCHARSARKPEARSEKLPKCLEKHRASFERSYTRAAARAARELAICTLAETPAAAAAQLAAETQALANSVTTGEDPGNPHDGRLRAALLGESAKLCSAALAAEAKHVRKPDDARRGDKRTKARARFDGRAARSTEKAAARGVDYAGADPSALGGDTEALVDARLLATSP